MPFTSCQFATSHFFSQSFCQNFFSACPLPPTSPLNLDGWFKSPKPNPLPAAKKPSGHRLKVLHLSDFHLDPRASDCIYPCEPDFHLFVMKDIPQVLKGIAQMGFAAETTIQIQRFLVGLPSLHLGSAPFYGACNTCNVGPTP